MVDYDKLLSKYGKIFSKGLVAQFAPGIAKGAVIELLFIVKMDVKTVSDWVQTNASLWEQVAPKHQRALKSLAKQIGGVEWLTGDYVIEAIKKDHPALASLFIGWVKARNWLERQAKEIKKNLNEGN